MTAGMREWLGRLSPETLAIIERELKAADASSNDASAPEEEEFLFLADGRRVPGHYEEIFESIGNRSDAYDNPRPNAPFAFGHMRRKVPLWNNHCDLDHPHGTTCGSITYVEASEKDYFLGKLANGMPSGITAGRFTDILPQEGRVRMQEITTDV